MENNPLVTIFFLAYNCEKYLEKSIKPIIDQTYPNIQIIISNNQSTDNTEAVIKKIQSENPKIIYRKNVLDIKADNLYDACDNNVSGSKNIKRYDVCFNHCNGCLKSGLAKGEFIIFCHQDDIYHRDIVEKEVEFFKKNPNAMGVFSLGKIIDKNDRIIGEHKLPKELQGKNIYNFSEVFKSILNNGNLFLITPTFMARKEVFEKVGLFDDQGPFGGSDDLEMWLKILEKYPMGILQENLIDWRTDGRAKKYNQLRTEKADFFKVMDYYLIDKGFIKLADKKNLRQYAYQKNFDDTLRAMNFLIKGNVKEAKKIINSSFSWSFFRALLENITLLRTKLLILKIILFVGINLGFGKYLGRMLYKII